MVLRNKRPVNLTVDSDFFDNVFEKERKRMEMKIKLNTGLDKRLSQVNFTKMIAQKRIKHEIDLFKNGTTKRKKR